MSTAHLSHELPIADGSPVRLRELLAPRRGDAPRVSAAIVAGLAGQLAGIGLLASSAWLITTASLRPPVLTLTVAIAAVQFFSLARGAARYGERLAAHDLAFRILARLRVWAFARIEPLVPGHLRNTRRGDLLTRFVTDVDGIQDLYVRSLLPLAGSLTAAALAAVYATFLDQAAGITLAVGLAAGALGTPALAACVGIRGGAQLTRWRGQRDGLVVEILHGADDLAVFGAVPHSLARLEATERQVAHQARRAALATSLGAAASVGLGGLLAAAVIAASLPGLHRGTISGITVAVLGFLGLAAGETVSGLPEAFAALAGTLGGARRLAALASTAQPPAAAVLRSRPASRPPALALQDVTVSYEPEAAPVLLDANLCLDPGRHLALVGPSGAGKTTVGHLLLRFVEPDRGRVCVDGVDIRRLDAEQYRRLVAWAPQDPHVFHATLAANLRLARPDATDEDLAAVLDQLGLGPWLTALPEGLKTILGERGITVSGGERQRLGVARAVLADRPVMILDEPTAHLDSVTAALLVRSVLSAAATKTVVWITHQPDERACFDQVASIDHGRLSVQPCRQPDRDGARR